MEVVAATPNGNGVPPFHNHDVREWSRIDSLTGVLERARLETDHWAANTSNSSHKYGKVVDSRARSDADGAVQQRARRQLEVYQSTVPGGHLQVIKTHTISSSRWTSKTSSPAASSSSVTSASLVGEQHKDVAQHFGDLELSVNPLDISSQKSKATVGRSVGRRPPSRPRLRDETSSISRHAIPLNGIHATAAANLHRVSRLCHQIHENAVKQTFGKYKPPIHERESGDGVEIVELESVNSSDNERPLNGHANLTRTKSTSSEDLHLLTPEKDKPNKSIEDLEDLEQLQNWRRTSKIRRSLQFPKQNKASVAITTKPHDLPENTGSVRKIREDLETGRRLSTALRGNNVDLEALDQILQSISDRTQIESDKHERPEKDASAINALKKQKRNSFVTVESLQEVRGRLRRTSSPTEDLYKINKDQRFKTDRNNDNKKEEEADDGIVTEENSVSKQFDEMPVSDNLTTMQSSSRVRSYVYGMETMMNKKPVLGTGSLESRTSKQLNGATSLRNEDWYNRRKSYGFEQVHNHQEPINSMSKSKGLMESSTDSGICRSSEIMLTSSSSFSSNNSNNRSNVQLNRSSDYNSEIDSEKEDKYNFSNKYENQNGGVVLNVGNVKRYTSMFEQKQENSPVSGRKMQDLNNSWSNRPSREEDRMVGTNKDFEGTTITIPIVNSDGTNFIEDPSSSWSNQNGEIKRHSIAVDESKYVTRNINDNKFRRTSLAINDHFMPDGLDDDAGQGKKQKKVEFCKTEVHFAADSGRVNIVATDEKPPPTNNFRRRRRNSAALYNQLLNDMNKNGLPVLHFGDSSYEKTLFGIADQEDDSLQNNVDYYYDGNKKNENDLMSSTNTVTVSTNQSYTYQQEADEDLKENQENEAPKGILKNKPIKPKPYLLGDEHFFKQANSDSEENPIWGVKLKPVNNSTNVSSNYNTNKYETPMWRSTVTLKNTLYDRQQQERDATLENSAQPEFQKLLKTLRPTKKQEFSEEEKVNENYDGIRIVPPQPDPRRSSWSVADMVKQVEDQKSENKGYSTKINIGGGEATVIQDNVEDTTRHPTWPRRDDSLRDFANLRISQNSQQTDLENTPASNRSFLKESNSRTWETQQLQPPLITNRVPHSPVILRKSYNDELKPHKQDLKPVYDTEKLSSPFLVGQNVSKNDYESVKTVASKKETELSGSLRRKKEKAFQNSSPTRLKERRSPTPTKDPPYKNHSPVRQIEKRSPSPVKQLSVSPNKHSPSPSRKFSPPRQKPTTEDSSTHRNSTRQKSPSRSVLRNPRKSEMAYFGVKASPSPKPARKSLESNSDKKSWNNKPDLLQHYDKKENVRYRKEAKVETSRREKSSSIERAESPIYENMDDVKRYKPKTTRKEFDSSILDELTKAADQILQAVNGYAEDAQKQSEEEKNKRAYRKEKLDTISETKSWKQGTSSKHRSCSKSTSVKSKLKHTSSTSSVESVSEHRKSVTPVRRTLTESEKNKKKSNGESSSSSRAATKARRLQRASSREALLQSHGSSSEDLPVSIEVPVRKPRMVRKTKATQLTVTNVVEISKTSSSANRKREEKGKSEERIPVGALPEIRHKTAVSTIRSTAEKAASREQRTRLKSEELKKRTSSRKESSRTMSVSKNDSKVRSISSKDPINHRISTANIKKCNKSEGSTRH